MIKIADLIARAEKEQEANEKAREDYDLHLIAEIIDFTRRTINERLPELMPVLDDTTMTKGIIRNANIPSGLSVSVNAKGLAAFQIVTYRKHTSSDYKWFMNLRHGSHVANVHIDDELMQFFLKIKAIYEQEQARKRTARLNLHLATLGIIPHIVDNDGSRYEFTRDRHTALNALNQIISIEPAREQEWRRCFNIWEERVKAAEEREAQAAEEKKKKNEFLALYREAYEKYWAEVSANWERLEGIKKTLGEEEYQLTKFYYSIIAAQEGIHMADETWVWVLGAPGEKIDPTGYMSIAQPNGQVESRLFYERCHIGEGNPEIYKPDNEFHPCAPHVYLYLEEYRLGNPKIYYSPLRTRESVDKLVEAALKPMRTVLPNPKDHDVSNVQKEIMDIQREIMTQTPVKDSDDYIPF